MDFTLPNRVQHRDNLSVNRLEVQELIVRNPLYAGKAHVRTGPGGVSLFLSCKDSGVNSIIAGSTTRGSVVGIYGDLPDQGCKVAMIIGHEGNPMIQIMNKSGALVHLGFDDLQEVANLKVAVPKILGELDDISEILDRIEGIQDEQEEVHDEVEAAFRELSDDTIDEACAFDCCQDGVEISVKFNNPEIGHKLQRKIVKKIESKVNKLLDKAGIADDTNVMIELEGEKV